MPADTIPARLIAQARNRPGHPAYGIKVDGQWRTTPWGSFADEVRTAAKALIALGFEPGHTVAILGFNRPEWVIMDVAALSAGGVPAGIYTTCSPEEVQYIVDHAESRVVLVENADQWAKVEQELERLPRLEHVVLMKGAPAVDHPKVLSWEGFLARGEGVADADFDARIEGLADDQLATLIYTSGTTGPPKGVMLSHRNIAWTSGITRDIANVNEHDCNVSYLPLSHIAEQMFSIYSPITYGSTVYYAESLDALPENLKEIQPTVFFGVPRIWEKFNAAVSAKLDEATGLKKRLVTWAMGVGRKVHAKHHRGEEVTGLLARQHALATKLIFSKLKPAIGLGRARFCVSGAAPISAEVLEFFTGLDITILEVYGQSEDCGPTSFNVPGRTKLGTVGPAIPGVEVRIAEDGEILVKGPNVFLGYYKDPEATAETLQDGWMHSGDLGAFDDDGFLTITGRKKDIIITAGGKNITPKNIEAGLKDLPLVNEAVVIGDRRKFLSALVTLDEDAARAWCESHGVSAPPHESAEVRAEIQRGVDEVNRRFARVESIRKFTILPRNLTVEDGELTPTLKVKRRIVNEHFADEIESMYR